MLSVPFSVKRRQAHFAQLKREPYTELRMLEKPGPEGQTKIRKECNLLRRMLSACPLCRHIIPGNSLGYVWLVSRLGGQAD